MPRRVPSLLLLLTYAAALGVAIGDVGARALPGAVVLGGLLLRAALRHRRTVAAAPHRRAAVASP